MLLTDFKILSLKHFCACIHGEYVDLSNGFACFFWTVCICFISFCASGFILRIYVAPAMANKILVLILVWIRTYYADLLQTAKLFKYNAISYYI